MASKQRFYKVKPTLRQRKAVNNILSREFKSFASAMRDAGYSEKSSFNPKHTLANRRGVQAYIGMISEAARRRWGMSLPEKVMNVYFEGLEATKLRGKDAVEHPDWPVRMLFADKFAELFGWTK